MAVGLLHWTGIEVEVQEKQFTFIVTLFIQKYKWVLAKCQGSWLKFLGGRSNTLCCFMLQKPIQAQTGWDNLAQEQT